MWAFPPGKIPARGPAKPTPRARVLAEFRRVDLAPLEKAAAPTSRHVSACLPNVLSGLRLDRRRSEAEVVKVWNHLLDPNITAHAQPVGYRNGTLFVNVDSSVWLSEIVRYRRKEIMDRMRSSFGPDFVMRISFRLA